MDKTLKNVSVQWQYLALELNDTVVQVTQETDTLEVSTFSQKVQKYQIGKTEKDSLFAYANALVDFKKQPPQFCTDYVGKLKVRVRYNSQLLKEVRFSSICDWRELDANTNKIDQLLKKIAGSK